MFRDFSLIMRTDGSMSVVYGKLLTLTHMQSIVGDSLDPDYTSLIEYCPVVEGAVIPDELFNPIMRQNGIDLKGNAYVRDVIADEEGRLRGQTYNLMATVAVFGCVPPQAPFWIVGDVIAKLRIQEESE